VLLRSLVEVEKAIRSSWCADTCDPVDLPDWSVMNPARGQCASTALIVQELLGGQLLIADVRHADGTRQGVHYWNRLPSGVELDLTREQFLDSEAISRPRVVRRPQDTTQGRLASQYRLLAEKVRAKLANAVVS
jgi:hypothetical protein